MSQIDDQAAKEAAELLPCVFALVRPPVRNCECYACSHRPAVAERLRQRDEVIDALNSTANRLIGERDKSRERIAALENDIKDLAEDVLNRGETIVALEAENERLREFLQAHVDDPGECYFDAQFRAALAGRK